jgi:hypothetical protein
MTPYRLVVPLAQLILVILRTTGIFHRAMFALLILAILTSHTLAQTLVVPQTWRVRE